MFDYVAKKNWEKEVEEERQHFANVGKKFVEPTYPEPQRKMEEVEIEREEFYELTCSSEEPFINDEKSVVGLSDSGKPSSSALRSEKPRSVRDRARSRIWMKEFRFSMNLGDLKGRETKRAKAPKLRFLRNSF